MTLFIGSVFLIINYILANYYFYNQILYNELVFIYLYEKRSIYFKYFSFASLARLVSGCTYRY